MGIYEALTGFLEHIRFSEVDGVEIDFFEFCVGTHHEVLAPEIGREHSIEYQFSVWNVEFMARLHSDNQLFLLIFNPIH